jgi:cell division septum initiation protein DivIVA
MTSQQLEARLSSMEQEIAQLKSMISSPDSSKNKTQKWWHKIAGSAASESIFDEAEQLGREWRRSAD